MNPDLDKLQPYPFEKLRALFAGVTPNAALAPISLSIGEPKHATPELIKHALADSLGGLASYPATAGRRHCARRSRLADAALRAPRSTREPGAAGQRLARGAVRVRADGDRSATRGAVVVCPNPFYQIYEGAALLAGATPVFAERDARSRLRRRLRVGAERRVAARTAPVRLLAGESDRPRDDARRMGASCSSCPTGTAS